MEYIYFHQYAIKFKINKELNKKEKQFLNSPLYQLHTENSGIITSSINILSDNNIRISELHNPFIGERIIPLEEFQKRVQKSELIYIWNSLTQFFKEHIKYYAIEQGFIKEEISSPLNKLNVIFPMIKNYKNYLYSTNKNSQKLYHEHTTDFLDYS